MADSKTIKAILEYDVNTASQQKTLKSLSDVDQKLDQIGKSRSFDQLTVSAEQYQAILLKTGGDEKAMLAELDKIEQSRALKQVADDADKASTSTKEATDNVKKLADETAKGIGLNSDLSSFIPTSGQIRSSDLGRVGNLARFAGQAGIPGAGQVSGALELAGAAQDIAGASVSLGAVLAVAAPLAIVGGVLALAMEGQRQAEEKLAEATKATIAQIEQEAEIRQQTAGAIATGSPATVRAQITEAETQRDALLTGQYRETVDKMQAYVDQKLRPQAESEARGDLRAAGINPGDDIFASELKRRTDENLLSLAQSDPQLKTFSDTLRDPTDKTKGLDVQLDKLNATIDSLTNTGLAGAQALEALNRPLEDQKTLRDLEAKSSADLVKQRLNDVDDLNAMNKRIAATEAAITEARANGNDTLAEVLTNQNVKNRADADELGHRIKLIDAAQGVVKALEQETAAGEKFGNMLKGLLSGASSVVGDVLKVGGAATKAQTALDTAEQAHADKRLSIIADEAEKEAAILADASDNAAKLGQKYGIDQTRAQEDLNRELEQLRAQANFDETQAVANRDAVSFGRVVAQEKLTENKDKENARVTAQRRQQDYQIQLHDLAVATQKRLDQQRAAEVKALNLEDQRWQIEQTKLQQQVSVTQQAFDAMSGSANKFGLAVAAAVNSVNSSLGRLNTGSPFGNVVSQVFQQHATGDIARYTGLHWLEQGERVLTLPQTAMYDRHDRRSHISVTHNLQIDIAGAQLKTMRAANRKDVLRAVDTALMSFVEEF